MNFIFHEENLKLIDVGKNPLTAKLNATKTILLPVGVSVAQKQIYDESGSQETQNLVDEICQDAPLSDLASEEKQSTDNLWQMSDVAYTLVKE